MREDLVSAGSPTVGGVARGAVLLASRRPCVLASLYSLTSNTPNAIHQALELQLAHRVDGLIIIAPQVRIPRAVETPHALEPVSGPAARRRLRRDLLAHDNADFSRSAQPQVEVAPPQWRALARTDADFRANRWELPSVVRRPP